jgi:2-succinyl-5-enolpyruvyl-6-hydroxy-3-cyclohexene-1-carboxylate synthase
MIPLNRTFAPLQVMADEFGRCGMTHAVCSPGSRDAPILLTLAADDAIETVSVLDERSAGFVALGLAKASRRPVAVACTSGTAAANLHPAVVEAHEAGVPLIVLTADRPPELREVGAGQAIDQVKLFGSAVKWFVEAGNHDPGRATAVHFRALACRLWDQAASGRPGPVHINLPLREPLSPVAEELDPADWEGRPGDAPWTSVVRPAPGPDPQAIQDLAAMVREVSLGVIVAGETREDLAEPLAALSQSTGWPVLADPLSGVRCGPHDRSRVVSHYDALLRSPAWVESNRPSLALRVGDTPTSKPLRAWLAEIQQVLVDPDPSWHEPTRQAGRIVVGQAAETCSALAAEFGPRDPSEPWLEAWLAADAIAAEELAAEPDPFEPRAYTAVAESLEDGATLWVSSSMPIREIESFFPSTPAAIRFLSNRGANGIDGVVSSAVGAAMASDGPTVLLTGELALLHDLSGLVTRRRLDVPLTIICVNNGGGGIFDFLPVADSAEPDSYEELIATPHDIPLETVAELGGLDHVTASTPDEIRAAVRENVLIEVRTDRAENLARHRALTARIAERLAG